MHVAHFSLQEFSDEPIQSLMIVIVSTVVVSVIQNSPRACWRRQSAPVALSSRSRLRKGLRLRRPRVPRLSSFLFTLLSVHFCQCCNAGTTIRLTPVLAALRSGATCARSSAASSCHTGSRTAALARGDDGDPHCWSGREGGRREGTPPPPPPPPTLARGRARISMK